MDTDTEIRDRLYAEVWKLYYNCLYAERASEFMLNRWLKVDYLGRPFVALFASGSAIAGWTLWNTENGRFWWSILAGGAALISITSSVFGIQDRIKRFAETKTTFTRLRIRLQWIIAEIKIRTDFDIAVTEQYFKQCHELYGECFQTYPHDLFFSEKNQTRIQEQLNKEQLKL